MSLKPHFADSRVFPKEARGSAQGCMQVDLMVGAKILAVVVGASDSHGFLLAVLG